MPITLNANKFIGTLTNLIAYSEVLDTYKIGGAINKLLDTFRSTDIADGDGKVIISAGLPSVTDLNAETSSVLSVVKPTVSEQPVFVNSWKKVQLTINQYLMRGAFVKESAMATLVAYLMKTMEVAKKKHMYDTLRNIIASDIGNIVDEDEQEIPTVNGIAIGDGDDVQTIMSKKTYNTTEFFKLLKVELKKYELGLKNSYKNFEDGIGRLCIEDGNNFVCIVSPELWASLDVDALAVLLNSAKLTEGINIEFIQMEVGFSGDASDISYALLCTKDAYTYGFFYQVATTFFDPSNLNTNHWLHFSYYADVVEYAPKEVIHLENFTF